MGKFDFRKEFLAVKIPCAMCGKAFEPIASDDQFCCMCEMKLIEFFEDADYPFGDAIIDWDLLASEMRQGLVVFDGSKLISVGQFPSCSRS